MAKTHLVVQGEYLSKIARAYGFADFHTIWDAPENKELKEKRKNPNILYPGDEVVIPEKETREESRATEKKHRFELQGEKLMLRLKLMDLKNKPVEGHACRLILEGDSKEFTTKSDGILEEEISTDHGTGKLMDRGKPDPKVPFHPPLEVPLKIGHLDPEDKVSGQIARLNNLGYSAGEVPDHTLADHEEDKLRKSPQFLSAVEEFQCDFMGQNNLNVMKQVVDGICGEKTQKKLLEIHGC